MREPLPQSDASKNRQELLERIVEQWFSAERGYALSRYAIAVQLSKLKDSAVYGSEAVEEAARRLKRSASQVYRDMAVVDAWPEEEFREMAGRSAAAGGVLRWWHFVAVASVDDSAARQTILETALSQGLSVREVQNLAAAHTAARNPGISTGSDDPRTRAVSCQYSGSSRTRASRRRVPEALRVSVSGEGRASSDARAVNDGRRWALLEAVHARLTTLISDLEDALEETRRSPPSEHDDVGSLVLMCDQIAASAARLQSLVLSLKGENCGS